MRKKIAIVLALLMLIDAIVPGIALALTSGPSQPEFSSFEPVTTTSMVNEFSGSFTYNLPLLEVPGPDGSSYPLSLSYHSGSNVETESSWVGYGWTLNPGSINRNKRGFADDARDAKVTYYNKMEPNVTASFGASLGAEIYSFDFGSNAGIRYNNYKGFGYVAGLSLGIANGTASLGYSYSDGNSHFSAQINPASILGSVQTGNKLANGLLKRGISHSGIELFGSQYGILSYAENSRTTNSRPYSGASFNFNTGVSLDAAFLHVGLQTGLSTNVTWQKNRDTLNLQALGYMYSGDTLKDNTIMDYYLEKEQPYIKQDKFLAIPFSNADNFQVMGEGLGGGFRLFNRKAGHFVPNKADSDTPIINAGVDVGVGQVEVEVGVKLGGGNQNLKVQKWETPSAFARQEYGVDEPYFFRFNNDLGGSVTMDGNKDAASKALVQQNSSNSVPRDAKPLISNIATGIEEMKTEGQRSNRSSLIAFNTNNDITNYKDVKGKSYKQYAGDPDIEKWIIRDDIIKNGIGELVTFNESGYRYVYGLPVYARNEKHMRYDLIERLNSVNNNYLAYKRTWKLEENITQIGEEDPNPYATSFLLTAITTPDYVDLTEDGLTPDDFGGYTRFVYDQAYGTPAVDMVINGKTVLKGGKGAGDNWYHWRLPYTGLLYERGELSNSRDDLGSKMSGEKEVYYLSAIETKTHIAYFILDNSVVTLPNGQIITGSGEKRRDAMDANAEVVGDSEKAAEDPTAKGKNPQHKLEKIMLFSKEVPNGRTLIKTINFAYDYSSCPNTPNNSLFNPLQPNVIQPGTGKLTLKKVWFEYQGTVHARISPYVFSYAYKNKAALPAEVLKKYGSIFDEYGPALQQNPRYSPFDMDRWGYYQFNGKARHEILNPWVSQQIDPAEFDPAAWQLKGIRLPSGGEILIQYEQNDYAFVQNQPAMVMTSLLDKGDSNNEFFINTTDLGISPDDEGSVEALANTIQKQIIERGYKIYFKFLYALTEHAPDLNSCASDYITGYADVEKVDVEKNGNQSFIRITLAGELPKDVCSDFVKIEKVGNIVGQSCDPSDAARQMGGFDESEPVQFVMKLGGFMSTLGGLTNTCPSIKHQYSYLRIPTILPKKGGGIRVKRLMMLDAGLEYSKDPLAREDAMLFGNEYVYETRGETNNVISSGVATTEPSKGREENSIVNPIKRFEQDFIHKIIAGEDRKKTEGFLGESILPGPSIGYSRVLTKNIHTGKSNPGFTVHEFFTCKDRPFLSPEPTENNERMTDIDQKDDLVILPLGLVNYNHSKMWLSQGFSFIANSMHGQIKKITNAGGDATDESTWSKSSSEEYFYYEPGEAIPLAYGPGDIRMGNPGKEMELTFESRAIEDLLVEFDLEIDFGIGYQPPVVVIPFASAGFGLTANESLLKTHTTSKVVRYPAFVKSVITKSANTSTTTNYVGFDPATGRPLIIRTDDDYDLLSINSSVHNGKYNDYQLPAYQQYRPMAQKSLNDRYTIVASDRKVTITKETINNKHYLVFTGPGTCDAMSMLSPGSLVRIRPGATDDFYNTDEATGNKMLIYPSSNYACSTTDGTAEFIEIVKSGYTNQLTVSAGDIKVYGATTAPAAIHSGLVTSAVTTRASLVSALNDIQFQSSVEIAGSKFPKESFASPFPSSPLPACGIPSKLTVRRDNAAGKLFITMVYGNSHLICNTAVEMQGGVGKFDYDRNTGVLIYRPTDSHCYPVEVGCIKFCESFDGHQYLTNVVEANAKTMTDKWDYNFDMLPRATTLTKNPYELGLKGKWRQKSNYVYQTDIKDIESVRAFDAGVFAKDMAMYNYQYENLNDPVAWLRLNTVERYSYNGNATDEVDAMGIPSAAKFGYHNAVPYLIASNANNETTVFESFENQYPFLGKTFLEDGMVEDGKSTGKGIVINSSSHSGKYSLMLQPGQPAFLRLGYPLKFMRLTQQLVDNGLSVKVWVKEPADILDQPIRAGKFKLNIYDNLGSTTILSATEFGRICKTGEWALYAAAMDNFGSLVKGDLFEMRIHYNFANPSDVITIDDIRVQPNDAHVNCYVYDLQTLKLLASFDDQHLGLYYQYNAEGKLIRKLIETEKGIKTIAETQYNTPLTK